MTDTASELAPATIEAGAAVLRLASLSPEYCGEEATLACDVFRAMLEAAWQSIETAPKDETEILLFVPDMQNYPDNPRVLSAYWGTCGWTDNAAVGCQTWGHPTHWMPLPEPPSAD